MICPYCNCPDLECDEVDIGVGYQQSGPYVCFDCGAVQIGPYDEPSRASEEEIKIGFYKPDHEWTEDRNNHGDKG